MIISEFYKEREDGVVLNRTYSDKGFYITRDGVLYIEAIDPVSEDRVYAETDQIIPIAEEVISDEEAFAKRR